VSAFGLGPASQPFGLCCISLQFTSVSLVLGGKLATVLWMWFQVLKKTEKKIPYLAHATWYTASPHHCKGALLARVQPDVQQEPPVLLCWAAS